MLLEEKLFEEGDFEEFADKAEIPAVEEEPIPANELVPETPEQGADTGIANLLHDLIISEHEAVQNYNNTVANLESRPELIPIMQSIANDKMTHIGMLEVALELLSPNAESMEEGEAEAEEIIDNSEEDPGSPVDEAINTDNKAWLEANTIRDTDKLQELKNAFNGPGRYTYSLSNGSRTVSGDDLNFDSKEDFENYIDKYSTQSGKEWQLVNIKAL